MGANPLLAFDVDGLLREVLVDDSGALLTDSTAAITVARASVSAAASGDNTLIAAAGSGIKIKVLGCILVADGDVDVRFESGASGTALTGRISLAAAGNGFVLPMAPKGYHWIETAANALLNLELTGNVQVSGCIVYHTEA